MRYVTAKIKQNRPISAQLQRQAPKQPARCFWLEEISGRPFVPPVARASRSGIGTKPRSGGQSSGSGSGSCQEMNSEAGGLGLCGPGIGGCCCSIVLQ